MKKRNKIILIIVGIVLLVFYSMNYFSNGNRRILEEDYEVLFFDCMDSSSFIPPSPMVEMKSLGDRTEQVWGGLIYLHGDCPNGESYYINIIEETQECGYIIEGSVIRGYISGEINDTEIKDTLDYKVWEDYVKKELIKISSGTADSSVFLSSIDRARYEKINETGITPEILFDIIEYNIKDSRQYCS